MDAFEKAKIALRKHLEANKSQVLADLKEMKKRSTGNDIYSYLESFKSNFSIETILASNKLTYPDDSYKFEQYTTSYDFVIEETLATYEPPYYDSNSKNTNPEEILQGFFISL
jgi:hypothetical protein